jgi:chromosome partitioning protein
MRFRTTQIITFANQKGGCGKTSSAVSVAAAFAQAGYSVCLLDTDSQCNTTDTLGIDSDEHIRAGNFTLADIYLKRVPAAEVEVHFGERFGGLLTLIPGHRALRSVGARLETEKLAALANDQHSILDADDIANEQRQRLRESLKSLRGKRDIVIIDTPPDLDFEMTTALIASDWFVIPVFPSGYDLKGLETLVRTVEKVRKRYNPTLRLAGVLLGNYDRTAKLDKDIHRALVDKFGEDLVFRTTIARSVKHRESTLYRRTIFEHAPGDQASMQYAELLKELINRGAKGAFSATLNPLPDENALGRIAPGSDLDEFDEERAVNG